MPCLGTRQVSTVVVRRLVILRQSFFASNFDKNSFEFFHPFYLHRTDAAALGVFRWLRSSTSSTRNDPTGESSQENEIFRLLDSGSGGWWWRLQIEGQFAGGFRFSDAALGAPARS